VGNALGLIGALGKKYMELKQYALAEAVLKRYVEISGDQWAFQELAACYTARGDARRAKETIDNYLNNTESGGLQHAQVQVETANKLMSQGKFQEAKPYADAAAETWAAFGLICASKCYEGLKDWAKAEQWSRLTSERYSRQNWGYWYIWCKRTGHGDLKAAHALAQAHLAEVAGSPEPDDLPRIGFFCWSIGSPKKALEFMEEAYAVNPAPLSGISIVLLADQLDDRARRDQMLDQVAAQFQGKVPRMVTLCTMIRGALAKGGKAPLDLTAVDQVLDRMPAKNRVNGDFLVGRYLLNRRQPAEARKYLKRCAELGEQHVWVRLLATDDLRSIDAARK
jgi:tetratricopeptide (TPR) repeat protein